MTPTLKDSLHLVAAPENLEASVVEVFATMLGLECRLAAASHAIREHRVEEWVTAVVGFGGIFSGACVFRCNAHAARTIAASMAGMEFASVDDVVKDAIGEICNMLAGTWKGKVPGLAANCGLSVPAVITGSDYDLRVQSPEFKICQNYTFDTTQFEITIVCDALQ